MIKVGLIGAGAIARHSYLPLFRNSRLMDLTAVVEMDGRIASDLQNEFGLAYAGGDPDEALKHVDAVIVCVPNHLHYALARLCLERGKHVLCEKPVCIRSADAEDLVRTAADRSLVFTVAHVRRYYPAVRIIEEMIASRKLGRLKGFDFREGTVFSWPSLSGYVLEREKAGGGVMMDIGVHLLDLLFSWVGAEVESFRYADDSFGGLESTVEIRMAFGNGVAGHVKLTRLSVLKNFYTLRFEGGDLSWNPFAPNTIYIRKPSSALASRKTARENAVRNMLIDFSESILKRKPPRVKGEEALASLRFIESCYAERREIPMPWMRAKGRP